MTDTLPTTAKQQAAEGFSSPTGKPLDLGSATTIASKAAPGISPSTAVTVASKGGDVVGNAQTVKQATDSVSHAKAATTATQAHPGGVTGWLDDIGHAVTSAVAPVGHYVDDALHALNLPLQTVQHEYRYLRDVEARHGLTAAIGEGLGIAAGAAGGFVLGGPAGAMLGGEGAAALEGQVLYKTSWARTQTGAKYKTPTTGDVISIGRTVAHLLGFHTGSAYSTLSGTIDAISDLVLTPLGHVGSIVGDARSAEGAKGLLGNRFGGLGITTPDDVDRAYSQYRGFRTAVTQIAGMDAGDIIGRYGSKFAGIARELGEADTPEEVLATFRQVAKANELRTTEMLPTMSFVSTGLDRIKQAAANYDGPLADNFLLGPARWSRRLMRVPGGTYNPLTHDWESQIDPTSATGATTIFRMVRYSQDDRTARMVATAYIYAKPADRINIFRNAVMDTVARMAHVEPLDPEIHAIGDPFLSTPDTWAEITTVDFRRFMKGKLDTLTGGANPMVKAGGNYGADAAGNQMPVIDPANDRENTAAIFMTQAGKMRMPNFIEMKRAAKMLAGGNMFLGRADDYLYEYVTQGFFKPLALSTPSYALHMVLAEVIPNLLRNGILKTADAAFHASYAKLGYDAANSEDGLNLFRTWMLRTFDHIPTTPDKVEAYAYLASTLEGHITPYAVSAADATSKMFSVAQNASKLLSDKAALGLAKNGKEFVQYGPDSPLFRQEWQTALREVSRNEEGRRAAATLADALEGRLVPDDPVRAALAQELDAARAQLEQDERALDHPGLIGTKGEIDIRFALRNESRRKVALLERQLAEMRRPTPIAMSTDTAIRRAGESATDYLRNEVDPEVRDLYQRSMYHSIANPPAGWDELDTWGNTVATAVHGLMGDDANTHLLRAIADGRAPTQEELGRVPNDMAPISVKGRAIDLPNGSSKAQRFANWNFTHILNPMIDTLSRQPIFATEFARQFALLKPSIEGGIRDYDEAAGLALDRAANRSMSFVHNIRTRSQWSETARNWFPFAFAQEQAYKRAGRLLAVDPGAFRRYQLMISGVHDWLAEQQDKTGNKWFTMPGSGILGKGVPRMLQAIGIAPHLITLTGGTSASIVGNFSSANVIFPLSNGFRPDLGPLATFSAKALYTVFPELLPTKTRARIRQLITQAAGTESTQEPVWEMAVPNATFQRVISGVIATHTRGFATTMVNVMNNLDYRQAEAVQAWIKGGRKGAVPDIVPPSNAPAAVQQRFINQVRNEVRVMYMVKAVVGYASPISPEVTIQTFGIKTGLNEAAKKEGSWTKGVTAYLLKNPEAWPFSLGDSSTAAGRLPTGTSASGAFLSESQDAQNWINDNQGLVSQYPHGAVWLMPQPKSTVFSQSVYNTQLAQGLRTKTTPTEYLDKLYITAGDNLYYAYQKEFYTTLLANATSAKEKSDLYTGWTTLLRSLEASNPIWAASYEAKGRVTLSQESINTLLAMDKAGVWPTNPQADKVKTLLGTYNQYESAYIAAGRTSDYSHAQSAVRQEWYNYLQTVKKADPTLVPVVTTVFEHALGTITPTTSTPGS